MQTLSTRWEAPKVSARGFTLLVTIPRPAEVVAEMVRLVRPGGWVAAMEFDMEFSLCYPPHPAFARICEIFPVVFARNGADPQLGRKVPAMFRDAGLTDVEVEARAPLYPQGHSRRTIALDLVRAMRPRVLEMGLASGAEFDELDAAARAHLADPRTIMLSGLPFLTWGRKPAGSLRFRSARMGSAWETADCGCGLSGAPAGPRVGAAPGG
jgi:hypothetical protein